MNVLSIFSKIYKGNGGEAEVLASITKLLSVDEKEANYFLIPKSTLKDTNGSREIDLLLLHPALGLYAIEVENWESLSHINSSNDPFSQANTYQDMLLHKLQEDFGDVPINVEYRVIFPQISQAEGERFFRENPYYANFANHTFFKEHMKDKRIFKRFFNASTQTLPNKKTFLKIASMLVPTDTLKSNKEKIIPVITKDEILFFDQKQLSILNGYTGGFRVIRGVAGTGKTVILTNFVSNRLQDDPSEKFLILCFNRKLVDMTKKSFGEEFVSRNIAVLSIIELLDRIGFDYQKAGIDPTDRLEVKYSAFETQEALDEFRVKLRARLKLKPIDYFLCDETQDMPAGFMRIIYEEIHDCIFFIDEAQRFYPYTMQTIAQVFHHPKFKKLSMRGRVKNLKNVYRTPSNIAQMAFEILSLDQTLNEYYKRSYYLKDSFNQDITMVLEEGNIEVGAWNQFGKLEALLEKLPSQKENVVLAYSKKSLAEIEKLIEKKGFSGHIKAITLQSVKGLEAQNVVIHNFDYFLKAVFEREEEIAYRKIYVLLTRAQENIYLSIDSPEMLSADARCKAVYEILLKASCTKKRGDGEEEIENPPSESLTLTRRLSKLKPVLKETKEGMELVVTASELFALIGSGFSFLG